MCQDSSQLQQAGIVLSMYIYQAESAITYHTTNDGDCIINDVIFNNGISFDFRAGRSRVV
jgi:hypothetical protein